jgi:hypothetical protein
MSFIPAPPPSENLHPVKPTMPGADQHPQFHSSSSPHETQRTYSLPSSQEFQGAYQHHQLHSSPSHHEKPYQLSSHEYQEQTNTISLIVAPVAIGALTHCQAGNQDASSSSSHQEITYILSHQECQEQINIISLIPAPATMSDLTNCQAMNARGRSTLSAAFQLQPP